MYQSTRFGKPHNIVSVRYDPGDALSTRALDRYVSKALPSTCFEGPLSTSTGTTR